MRCYRGHLCRGAARAPPNSRGRILPVTIHRMNTMARSTIRAAAAIIGAVLAVAVVLATCTGAGPYSTEANGRYDASTLSERHQMWGHLWASLGYVAILVDGFGPRGYPQGFPRGSYDQRPEALNEVTVRPLDAYGALGYLRTRPDVAPDSVVLQGWSNGGSATLAIMAVVAADTPGAVAHSPVLGFRSALALYPACGLRGMFEDGYRPYAPIRVFIGDADEEVSPKRCLTLVEKSRAQGGDIAIKLYLAATHGFDDPGRRRQSVDGNAAAKADAMQEAPAFFAEQLAVKR